jgi:hypothetical protein
MQHPPNTGAAWRYRIGMVDPVERDALSTLRRAAYRKAPEFDWIDEAALRWSIADDAGVVMALWDDQGAMLSTLRATVFTSAAAAEAHLEYSLAGIDAPTPTLVLSRAATLPAAARHGLFALLRHAYLQALAATPIASVIAIVYEGGPRLAAMRGAGYEFFEPRAGWDTEAVARAQPLLALLPSARFASALGAATAAVTVRLDAVHIESAAIAAALRARCTLA